MTLISAPAYHSKESISPALEEMILRDAKNKIIRILRGVSLNNLQSALNDLDR